MQGAHGAPSTVPAPPPSKPPSRCAQPGHRKSQRAAQARELGVGSGAPTAPVAASAARPSAFTLLAQQSSELRDLFLEVRGGAQHSEDASEVN